MPRNSAIVDPSGEIDADDLGAKVRAQPKDFDGGIHIRGHWSLLAGAELTKVGSLTSCAAFGNGSGKPRKMT